MTEHQINILKRELVPMIAEDIAPFITRVIEKRLQLFVDEFIKHSANMCLVCGADHGNLPCPKTRVG